MRRPRSLLETRSSTSISFTWTLSGLALAACGGGGGGGGSSSGPVVASYNITVYDGPISGASIYVDENENGLIDAGDTSLGKTDGRGIISVPKTAENKPLIAHLEGAVDSDNPDVILGDILWRAPVGSAVISPLTELVVEAGDEASVLLEELGLKGVDVSSNNPFDPLDPNPQGASDTVKVAAQMVAGIIDDDGTSSLLASLRHALDNKPTGFSLSAIEKN